MGRLSDGRVWACALCQTFFFENTLSIPDASPYTRCEAMHKSRPSLLASRGCTIRECTLNPFYFYIFYIKCYMWYYSFHISICLILCFSKWCNRFKFPKLSSTFHHLTGMFDPKALIKLLGFVKFLWCVSCVSSQPVRFCDTATRSGVVCCCWIYD